MNRRIVLLGLLLLSSASRAALADEPVNIVIDVPPPPASVPPVEPAAVAPTPEPLIPVEMPKERRGETPCHGAFALRTAAVGTFFKMASVSTYGGGIDVAVGGGKCENWDVFADLQYVQATTPGGLDVHAMSAVVAAEFVIVSGIRAGAGFGFSDTGVRRATTGDWAEGGGMKGLLRVGYDTGLRLRPIVLLEVTGVLANTDSIGVTLQAGVRF